jgi:hypothetical protein
MLKSTAHYPYCVDKLGAGVCASPTEIGYTRFRSLFKSGRSRKHPTSAIYEWANSATAEFGVAPAGGSLTEIDLATTPQPPFQREGEVQAPHS